jgi:nucleoside-triphosphatase THEP1
MPGQILLLTGGRGVGKSTVCFDAVTQARGLGYTCRGLVTLRCGIDDRTVLSVENGATRPLTAAHHVDNGVVLGRYRFDPATLAWGSAVLSRSTPCDLFIIDELGPLELIRGEGWVGALNVLRRGEFRLALVVVRPALVARVRSRLNGRLKTLRVTPENRDDVPGKILNALEDLDRLATL